jgi:hypothetical protein
MKMFRTITMKLGVRAPLTMLLLAALAPLTLARCGGSANDGGGLGTETGNPPVIKKEALHLEVAPGGMRLIGAPGAVTPGAEVRITNQRTGASAATNAAANGAVELAISGEASDVYEVTVSRGGQQATVTLTAADLPTDLSTLSCEALGNALGPVIAKTYAEADHSCAVDADCAERYWGEGCYNRCGSEILAASAVEATSALAEQRITGLCGEIEARGCRNDAPSCPPPSPHVLRCEQGQCVGREFDELSCEELSQEASRQRQAAAVAAPRSCAGDDDCALSRNDLSCIDNCGGFSAPVANDARDALESTIAQVEQNLCGQFERDACVVLLLPCVPAAGEPSARCEQGQCTVVYLESEPL